jgi:hypothetical protein
MPITFTTQTIKGLKVPSQGRIDYWDAHTQRFGCRVGSNGRKIYFVRYRVAGSEQKRRFKIGRADRIELAKARREAKRILSAADFGTDAAATRHDRRTAPTMGRICQAFIDEYARGPLNDAGVPIKPRKRTWRDDERKIQADILPAWPAGEGVGSCAVYSISASTIPVAINGTCATISASGFMTLVGP